MTLKEKFYKEFISKPDLYPLEECEKIAEEFAIGFAEWALNLHYKTEINKELLEIYKKEKGL